MEAKKDRLYTDVEYLTSLCPFRNYLNTETLESVCVYLRNEFQRAGLETKDQNWMAMGREYTNVIASYNKGKEKRLVVGAHYDVAGNQPGADDNASSVAGLIETGRLLGRMLPEIDYQIDLVAYCLEEPPFFGTSDMGSFIHARSLKNNETELLGMICYDMIGYFSDEPGSQSYPSPEMTAVYPDTANFIGVVGLEKHRSFAKKVYELMSDSKQIDVQMICFPDIHGLGGLSDQRNYWHFGYPAVMINDTAFIRNPNYHQITDTIDTLDFDKMAAVVNSCYHAIISFDN